MSVPSIADQNPHQLRCDIASVYGDPQTGFTFQHRSVTYTRKLRGDFYYADYSVGTTGARNGRVQHIRSADSLLWSDPATPPPDWITTYRMTPYWAGQQIREQASPCSAPDPAYPYSDSRCATIAEFALDGATDGEGVIESVSGVSSVPETLPPFGALDLLLTP